jgi:autotransporter-associated beta strand protein
MKSAGNRGVVARMSRRVRSVVGLGGRRGRRKLVTCLALLAMLVQLTPWRGGSVALAADRWTGAADANWDTAGNWTTGVPNASSDVLFPTVIPATGAGINLNSSEMANSLSFANAYALNNGDLTLASGNITVAPTFTATINSILAGGGGITLSAANGLAGADAVTGGGTLLLTGTNTFTGGVNINAGTLAFNNYGAFGTTGNIATSPTITINAGGTLENRNNGGTIGNNVVLNTGGTFSYVGTGQSNFGTGANAGSTLFLAGDATVNNLVANTGGKIFINGGQLGSNAGVVLTKTGAGVLQLAGANPSFQGSVVINGGFLEYQNVDALGVGTTSVTVNNGGEFVGNAGGANIRHNFTLNTGGTLSVNGGGSPTYTGTINVAGNANIQLRLFQTPTTANSMAIRGPITGSGNLNVFAPAASGTGIGSLLLEGNNTTYTGTFTVNPNATLRTLEGPGQSGLGTASVVLNGGTLGITPVVSAPLANAGFSGRYYNSVAAVLGNGIIGGFDFGLLNPVVTRNDATINYANNAAGFQSIAGVNVANMAGQWTGVLNIATGGIYNFQTISDDGSILYVDGQPVAQNDGSQGATTRGGNIDLTSGLHSIIVKYSNGGGGSAMIANYSGADTGNTQVLVGSIAGTLTNNGTNLVTSTPTLINNNLSLAANTGRSGVELSGTNATNSGTLSLGNFTNLLITGQSSGETFTQAGAVTINGIAGIQTGYTQVLNGQAGASTGADMVISGTITDAGSGSTLVKDGPRTLRFGANNVWNGKMIIAGGNLDLAGNSTSLTSLKVSNINPLAFGNTESITTGAGTLTMNGDMSFAGNSAGAITLSGNLALVGDRVITGAAVTPTFISATITSSGAITKNGAGAVNLGGSNGATYTGLTTINNGKLIVSNAGALGTTANGTVVNPGGTLEIANVTISEPLTLSGRGLPVATSTINNYGGPQYQGALSGTGFSAVASGPITLVGTETSIGVAGGNMLTISGVISGSGGLSKSLGSNVVPITTTATTGGPGILRLTGANTYSGPTIVRGGDLQLANASGQALTSTNIIIGDGTADATLTMVNNNQFAPGTIITFNNGAKNAKIQLNNTTQTVSGFNQLGGLAFIQNHENGAVGTGPGTLIVNNNADTRFDGEVRDLNGVLAITKTGTGTLTFSGDGQRLTAVGNYTGATTISGGKFLLSDSTTFISPITLVAGGGGSYEVFDNFGRTTTQTKAIVDNGAGFTKSGLGNLSYTNTVVASNVTGTVNVNAGVLSLVDSVVNNANTVTNGSATITSTNTSGLAVGMLVTGTGIPAGATVTAITTNTNFTISANATATNTNVAITGNVNPLQGAPINVAQGAQLQFNGITGATSFNNNVTLNGLTPGGALSGAVIGGTPDNTLTGTLTLNATSNISTGWADKTFRITGKVTGPGGLQMEKLLYTQQPPIFQLTNTSNDYAGGTTINAGTAYFADGALPSTGNLKFGGFQTASTLNILTGPTLVLGTNGQSSFTRSIGTGDGQVSFTGEGGGFSAIGGTRTVTFGGATPQLVDWGGAGFNGTASLFFNSSNTLGGGSAFNADSEVNITNDIVLSGAGLHRIYVADNNGSATDQVRFSGAISGPGGLLKDGGNSAGGANNGGTLILSGTGANTYTGLTNVQQGTLILAKTGVNAIGGDLQISNNQGGARRVVYLNANEQIADTSVVSFVGSSANNGDLRLLGFNETVAGINDRSGGGVIEVVEAETATTGLAGQNAGGSVLTINGNNDSFYNGFIRNRGTGTYTGTLSLVKNGTGTLTISAGQQSGGGNQTYSGTTTINAGKLVYANIGTFSSVPTIAAGATLEFAENINQSGTDGQIIGGAGNVIKSGLGTTILSVNNTYTGTTTVAGGTLSIQGAPTGTGTYIVNPGATLSIGNGSTAGAILDAANVTDNGTVLINRTNYTYQGVISGTGGVTNSVAASLNVLSGANTYTGVTTVTNGQLTIAGSGISGGGLVLNGGTLALDFTQANAAAGGIVAATAPVTFGGGTLSVIGNTASVQNLGAVAVNSGVSTLNASGNVALTLGQFTRAPGGILNISLPGGSTAVKTTGTSVGGILGGWAFTTGATPTFVAVDGSGNLSALTNFTNDTWSGGNVAVTTSSSQANNAVANSLTFNTAGSNSISLTGANKITSGGILVNALVGANNISITGGTLSGATAANGGDLIVNQLNTAGTLTIASNIVDNGGATGLTKLGGGTLILSGANTYTGNTSVLAGNVTVTNAAANTRSASVSAGATLQFGDGSSNNVAVASSILNAGTVIIANPQDQTLTSAFNVNSNFAFTPNGVNNPTSVQGGTLTKTGGGTLNIVVPVLTTQFHQKQGTTVIDTGGNVIVSSFNSIGLNNGDNATLTVRGAGRIAESGDFNVSDQASSSGTLNVQDAAQVIIGTLYVGKSGSSVGTVNQTLGTVSSNGGGDWRIGGGGSAADVNAVGTYNLSAGTFQTANNFQVGAFGNGTFNQTGGAATVTGGTFVVGRFTGGVGQFNLSNGTFTNTTANRMIVGEAGTGTMTVSGAGQLLFTSTAVNSGVGIGGINTEAGNGTVNLNGGLIQAAQVFDPNATGGTSTFNFNGGVLRVTAGSLAGATYMTGLTNAFVRSGGAFIDTNGVATTIGQPLLAPNDGSDTSGGLTKLNTGTLTLTAGATFGGSTTITGGVLALNYNSTATPLPPTDNMLPTTALNINGGGLLISGKASATSTQTFSGVNLNSTGTINATIGTGGTVNVTLNAINHNLGSAIDFTLPATGSITTTTANTTNTGNAATNILGGWATANNGATWAVSAGNGSAGAITALPAAGFTSTTWAAANNTDVISSTTQTNVTTNSLRFNTATAFNVTVSGTDTINSGGVLVTPTVAAVATGILGGTLATGFGNDLVINQYNTTGVLTISSIIAADGGSGGLVKTGSSTGVTLISAANTYNGNTVIGAGTLRLGVATAIPDGGGKGDVIINAGATLDLNNFSETINGLNGYGTVTTGVAGTPTLTVGNSGTSSTFSGTILNGTGTGTILTKVGGGILTLNNVAAGTYTGATNINGGAIDIATPNALSQNTTINVNVAQGLQFETTVPLISGLGGNSSIALQTNSNSQPVQLTIGNNNAGGTYSGALSGPGTLVKIGTGTETLSGNNSNDGGVIINAGTVLFTGSNGGANPTSRILINNGGTGAFANPNSIYSSSGPSIVVANGGVAAIGSLTANPNSQAFSSISSALSRIDTNSTGVVALTVDASLPTPISENIDFSPTGPNGAMNLSLGASMNGVAGLGNTSVQYVGVITPNANTLRIGGGNGRLILPNGATLAGANNLNIGGGGGGQLFLTANYGFTGSTTVNAGTTFFTSVANGGLASAFGASSSAAGNLILNGGTISFIGNGGSTDRLFTISAAPTVIDASGTAPINFTSTGAIGFLNTGNRTLTLQGTNTGTNTINAAIGDSINVAGANNSIASGTTAITKSGNGTWVLGGTNTFSGGVTVNNGLIVFAGPASVGGNTVNGPASVLVNSGGAAGLGAGFTGGLQAGLNRISPLSTGTVALTANTSENLNFDGGAGGATLPTAFLGAYGNVAYTGTLTPFGSVYRLGGGGGVLSLPNGGLTGPRSVQIGGGGPGTSFANNPNLNGAVVLGGTSDYAGGTVLLAGGVLSATSPAALGSGPLKFQGGFYRVSSNTDDITALGDGSARDIRIGTDTNGNNQTANVEVPTGISATFSKAFGPSSTFGANLGTEGFTKYGGGNLILAGGIAYNGTTTVERGTLTLMNNPYFYGGNVQVGSNNGGVGTLKLGANNFFASGPTFQNGNIVDLYNGSRLDLNGFSDTIRNVRGNGHIVNTGAAVSTLTVATNNLNAEVDVLAGNLIGNFNVIVGGSQTNLFGTGANTSSLELWNNNNTQFTGKLTANAGGIRIRADGTLGATTEAFMPDKVTLNNGAVLYSAGGTNVVVGANHGITLGAGGGTIWQFGTANDFVIRSPITGPGQLTIADDTGVVILSNDNNNYAGGTQINSNAAGRGELMIGEGGATGSLPAGDVFFNSGAGLARLYFYKSTNMTLSNTLNGPGQVFQVGGGTTTLNGNNNTNQPTFVGSGRLKVDFTDPTKTPIGTGTNLSVSAGAFEYVGPAGDNQLRLGVLTNNAPASPNTATFVGGFLGDATIQSTYGGSGTQQLIFASYGGRAAGTTVNFVSSGGTNGTTNRIEVLAGVPVNTMVGSAFYFNDTEFAAYDQGGFVRAANYGVDVNSAALNTMTGGRFTKLTTAITGQPSVSMLGIHLSNAAANINLADNATLTMSGNPGGLFKTGGGTSLINGNGSVNNNGQELIARTLTAADTLQIDVPINGAGQLTKSGPGTLILSQSNGYTGNTILGTGTLVLTGNGTIGTLNANNGSEMRIALTSGQTATLVINSPSAGFSSGATNNGFRVGELGNGIVNQSDGTLNAANYAVLGEALGSSGTYNISGGSFNVKTFNGAAPAGAPGLVVGRAGIGALNISGNSTVVDVMNGAQVLLGAGTFNTTQFQGLTPNAGISTGVGTITQTGGLLRVATNTGTFQNNLFGAVILGVDGSGTYNLNGGTLAAPILGRGNGTASFTLGSGTIQATAPTLNVDLPMTLTGTGANKGAIDTNGNDITFTSRMTGSGGLAKNGNGTLTAIGNSSYTGGTDINSGTLLGSGTGLGNGPVNVASGATLAVQGVQPGLLARFYLVNNININPNVTTGATTVAPEFTSLDNFNAFLAGKAPIAVETTTARGKTSVDYLDTGGANGNTAIAPAVLMNNNTTLPYTAQLTGKFNATTTGEYTFQTRSDDGTVVWIDGQPVVDNNHAQGQTVRSGTTTLTAGLHDIVIGYYEGGGGSGFSVGVTQPGQGQSYLNGAELNMPNALLSNGTDILQIGSLVGTGTVDLTGGSLSTGNDNSSTTFTGTILGAGNLIKDGTGTMTIPPNTTTYTGTTTVNNGTLSVTGSVASSSNIIVNGGTFDGVNAQILQGLTVNGGTARVLNGVNTGFIAGTGGTIQIGSNNITTGAANVTTSYGGNITGTGGLIKVGTGVQGLTGTNTYTGPTTISAGTLSVSGSIASSSAVTATTGGTFEASGSTRVRNLTLNGGQGRVTSTAAAVKTVLTVGDGTAATNQLNLTGGGKMDLTSNGMVIDYAAGNDTPVAESVRAQIIAGYHPSSPTAGDGDWKGTTGITSSTAAGNPLGAVGYAVASDVLPFTNGTSDTFLGTTVDKSSVLARYTLSGDLNLDGSVDFLDLAKLAQSYNVTDGTRRWATGDVNYDGNTDFLDLAKMAQNYNTALAAPAVPGASVEFQADLARAFAAVPEPGTISVLGIGALALLARRRNRRAA